MSIKKRWFNWVDNQKELGKTAIGVEQVKNNWIWIKKLSLVFVPKKLDLSKPAVSFDSALIKSGIKNEQDLKIAYKHFRLYFFVSMFMFMLSLATSLGFLIIGHNPVPMIGFIGVGSICLAWMFKSSYIAYQIRSREYKTFQEWKESKDWWVSAWSSTGNDSSGIQKTKKREMK